MLINIYYFKIPYFPKGIYINIILKKGKVGKKNKIFQKKDSKNLQLIQNDDFSQAFSAFHISVRLSRLINNHAPHLSVFHFPLLSASALHKIISQIRSSVNILWRHLPPSFRSPLLQNSFCAFHRP